MQDFVRAGERTDDPGGRRDSYRNGVFVLPDFLANAGGVTVSYFEQVQGTYNFYWPLDEVHKRLDEKMTHAFHGVYEMHLKEKVTCGRQPILCPWPGSQRPAS